MSTDSDYGLIVIDKPLGMTSRATVDAALRWFPRGTKIGHTGTLDPLATGVLVLCVGRATRLTEFVQDMGKTYVAEITLGARSATDDGEGPITPVKDATRPGRAAVAAAVRSFTGQVQQVPPTFSAAKAAGRRAYDLARRGSAVELAARTVRIDRIEILAFDYPMLRIQVECGKGTYIRSLARDLGDALGCGGYVAALRRTRVGPFAPEQAIPLEMYADSARARLVPMGAALAGLPRVALDEAARLRFQSGQAVVGHAASGDTMPPDATVAVFDSADALIGIGRTDAAGMHMRPEKVLTG